MRSVPLETADVVKWVRPETALVQGPLTPRNPQPGKSLEGLSCGGGPLILLRAFLGLDVGADSCHPELSSSVAEVD